MTHKLIKTTDYILVVDNSRTIGKGYAVNRDYEIMKYNTDEHLAYDSYAVKKIIAHLPLNGSSILEGVDLLPPIEDGIDYLAEIFGNNIGGNEAESIVLSFGYKKGYNKAREKYKYTEEDMRKALLVKHDGLDADYVIEVISNKYPTEFECEMEDYCGSPLTTERCPKCIDICDRAYQRPKTVTTAQGVQWVGKYK